MEQRDMHIKKVDNGYVIKVSILKEGKPKQIEAMLNLMRATGMYESWQEHKEEDIRRALEKMATTPFPEKEEKEVICNTLIEVISFMKNFYESNSNEAINL